MSFDLCGEFFFRRELSREELEELSFELADLALKERVWLLIGQNCPKSTREDLGRSDAGFSNLDIAYQITESPISTDSDQFVSPIDVEPIYIPATIRDGMRRVQKFLIAASRVPLLAGMSFYIYSSGSPQKEESPLESLANRTTDLYLELGYVPSMCFLFTF